MKLNLNHSKPNLTSTLILTLKTVKEKSVNDYVILFSLGYFISFS